MHCGVGQIFGMSTWPPLNPAGVSLTAGFGQWQRKLS